MAKGIELHTEESWQRAREYGQGLGRFPNVFSAAIRLLVADHQKHGGELRPVTKFLVGQALRGKKILSLFYYSTLRLNPDAIKDKKSVTLGEMVNLLQPFDLAALYATYLLYRRVRKHLGLNREQFAALVPFFRRESQMGGAVGMAIPKIGLGNGVLSTSIHHLGLGIIARRVPSEVQSYNLHLIESGVRWDPYWETERFGCTSVQVGAVLLTRLGFNKSIVEVYFRALDPERSDQINSPDDTDSIRFSRMWSDCILDDKDQPKVSMPGAYYPLSIERDRLQDEFTRINTGEISWFERDNEDISPEKTPMLFSNEGLDREVPAQLRDIFTLKEISEMGEEEFDALIDEIDKTIEDGTIDTVLSESDADATS